MTQEGLEQFADMAIRPPIIVSAPAESYVCAVCGRAYTSRGKKDPGNLCRACERIQAANSAPLIGGPLDGQVVTSGQEPLYQNDGGDPDEAAGTDQRPAEDAGGRPVEDPAGVSEAGRGEDNKISTDGRNPGEVLEPMRSKVEAATTWMEHLAADNTHGYKWGGWGPQDYDCGHAIITAWEESGVPVKTRGATYTGNMQPAFIACGFRDVTGQVNLKTGSGLKRGDVLINTLNHAAMYIGQGQIVHARGSEGNDIPGDQNGREICTQPYFDYNPWNCVLRFPESIAYEEAADGLIQEEIKPDGICGPATWTALAKFLPRLQLGSNGPAVKVLQEALNRAGNAGLDVDGDMGPKTELQLREFQEGLL